MGIKVRFERAKKNRGIGDIKQQFPFMKFDGRQRDNESSLKKQQYQRKVLLTRNR